MNLVTQVSTLLKNNFKLEFLTMTSCSVLKCQIIFFGSEYSRQSIPSTPAVTRKVRPQKFHNQHRRPGHDGAGYPDFRISSDDSDNERVVVNQKSKSVAAGELPGSSTKAKFITTISYSVKWYKSNQLNQSYIARSLWLLDSIAFKPERLLLMGMVVRYST